MKNIALTAAIVLVGSCIMGLMIWRDANRESGVQLSSAPVRHARN